MATQPTEDIEFATDGGALIADPGGPKKKAGFLVNEAPPAHWFDWLFNAYWKWFNYLKTFVTEVQTAFQTAIANLQMAIALRRQVLEFPYRTTWTARTAANAVTWRGLTWSPELNLFCAIANNGTTAQQVMTSPDGITWTARTAANGLATWNAITWSPSLSLFCAIGVTGTAAQQVMTSPDGITWTARTSANVLIWRGFTWSPNLSLFCAVAINGTAAQQVMTSPDGITWTARTSANAVQWTAATWSPSLGIFCAVAANGTAAQQVMTSPDGITWTARTSANVVQWSSVTWSPSLSLFCAVATNGTAAQQVMTSPDGITWTARTLAVSGSWNSVTWSPDLSLFCAVDVGGQTMTSPDGITWTARSAANAVQWQSVVWASSLGIFCAVASTGNVSQRVMTTLDPTIPSLAVIAGTTTDDNAAAGRVGEAIGPITRVFSNATPLTVSGTAYNVCTTPSLTLTPGDWDVRGCVGFLPAASTAITISRAGISATSATMPATDTIGVPTGGEMRVIDARSSYVPGNNALSMNIPTYRVTVAAGATLPLYLVAAATFTTSTIAAFGWMEARRAR